MFRENLCTHALPFFLSCLRAKLAKYSRQLSSHEASSFSSLPSFLSPFFYAVPLHFRTSRRFCRKSALDTSGILAAFALRHRTKEKNIRSTGNEIPCYASAPLWRIPWGWFSVSLLAFLISHRFLYDEDC